jgi:hypothetical protein
VASTGMPSILLPTTTPPLSLKANPANDTTGTKISTSVLAGSSVSNGYNESVGKNASSPSSVTGSPSVNVNVNVSVTEAKKGVPPLAKVAKVERSFASEKAILGSRIDKNLVKEIFALDQSFLNLYQAQVAPPKIAIDVEAIGKSVTVNMGSAKDLNLSTQALVGKVRAVKELLMKANSNVSACDGEFQRLGFPPQVLSEITSLQDRLKGGDNTVELAQAIDDIYMKVDMGRIDAVEKEYFVERIRDMESKRKVCSLLLDVDFLFYYRLILFFFSPSIFFCNMIGLRVKAGHCIVPVSR